MAVLFNILFFIIPLVFFKQTSELFEFNKIIIVYLFTILITSAWIYKSLKYKRIIFRRTILDIPILVYLFALVLSTLFSIDQRTSFFGYYSRFNGGLLSQICYSLLYYAFTSNISSEKQKIGIIYSGLIGTVLASILGIFEHFGIFTTCYLMGFPIDKSCWVQDVQNRVFSTIGQPNWLSALVLIFIPITWYFTINSKNKIQKIINLIFNFLLVATLIFTKSRSGLLAFGLEFFIFWGYLLFTNFKKTIISFLIFLTFSISLTLIFLPNKYLKLSTLKENLNEQTTNVYQGPALESGGTESGVIRKYVWLGSLNIFKKYPILGTGPETFAFVFPKFKPLEHNLTSEWDFIYNKAHNEFLNILATTGLVGFIAYIVLILATIIQLLNIKNKSPQTTGDKVLKISLFSSYLSILVTNFFGFSVVNVSLLFFLIPAFVLSYEDLNNQKNKSFERQKKLNFYTLIIIFVSTLLIYSVIKYFLADIYYSKAKNYNLTGNANLSQNYKRAKEYIEKAIKYSKNESVFHSEAGLIYSEIALLDENKNDGQEIKNNVDLAIQHSIKATQLSINNSNNWRVLSSVYYRFAMFTNDFLKLALDPLSKNIEVSPNDPKVHYQIGILYLKNGLNNEGLTNLEKSVQLKPNYKEARFALGLTYMDFKEYPKAIENFEYILKNIDPKDTLTLKYLEEAKNAL